MGLRAGEGSLVDPLHKEGQNSVTVSAAARIAVQAAREEGLRLVDLGAITRAVRPREREDGVHYTLAVNQVLMNVLWNTVCR